MASIHPIELPIPLSDTRLRKFCEQIRCKGEPFEVSLLRDKLKPYSNCYWNVLSSKEDYGGEIIYGWMLLYWPGLYFTAQHHAVWKTSSGNLTDITDRPFTNDVTTTFVFDSIQSFNINRPPNIKSEHMLLTKNQRVEKFIQLYHQKHAVSQQLIDFAFGKLGGDSKDHMAIARGLTPEGIEILLENKEEYSHIIQQENIISIELGNAINSLKLNPPNSVARLASKQYT